MDIYNTEFFHGLISILYAALYRRIIVFGKDDRILRSLLSGLNVYNHLVVPFSATVMLELRLDDELGYFVNVLLRNSTEELFYLTIPGELYSAFQADDVHTRARYSYRYS